MVGVGLSPAGKLQLLKKNRRMMKAKIHFGMADPLIKQTADQTIFQ
jgi:hypothetical protein